MSTSKFVVFEGGKSSGTGGSGPEDPMIEQRVARLEDDMKDIKTSLKSIEGKLNSIDVSVAEMKGKLSQAPNWIQLIGLTLATWAAGAAIVATLLRTVK
jgi:hypothetical protein